MNKSQIEQYRDSLLRQRSELQALDKTTRDAAETVELDQARVGRLSRMDAMQGQQMALETARRRKQRLAMIEGALRRIESGEYGYCFVCGDEIVARRLSTDPTITRCVDCTEKNN